MKALTIWQPWASLLAQGEKKYETRGWPTKYRGTIAIHAALRDPKKLPLTPELEQYALHNDKIGSWSGLPTGAIIAIGELVNVWRIGAEGISPTEQEMALGDWTPGRYAWEIKITELLEEPVPIRGKQGLWNWDEKRTGKKGD